MNDDVQARIREAAEALKAAGAHEVYVFGSAARGVLHEYSDVDFAVVGLPPERYFLAMGCARRAVGRPVDLVDLDESTPFTQCLKRQGELMRVG